MKSNILPPGIRDDSQESIIDTPKIQLTKAQYEAVKADKARRNTINSYYKYVLKCRPDLRPTHLHEAQYQNTGLLRKTWKDRRY